MSDAVYVLGNGLSRKNVNPYLLNGAVIGCNACYRDFEPDILIAIDGGVIFDIVESGYSKPCYFTINSWSPLPADIRNQLILEDDAIIRETTYKSDKFVVIGGKDEKIEQRINYIIWVPKSQSIKNIMRKPAGVGVDQYGMAPITGLWSAGICGIFVACKDLNPDKVYLIGFDLSQNSSYDNIYADTSHYFKADSKGPGVNVLPWSKVYMEWIKLILQITRWYPNIEFFWVNDNIKINTPNNLHIIESI